MEGNTPSDGAGYKPLLKVNRPEHPHIGRVKTMLGLLLPLCDVTALILAFILGYFARLHLPLLAIPLGQPPIRQYLPVLTLQVVVVVLVFYFSRLYHQTRVVSRFDSGRTVIGALTIGAVLASGLQELLFKNSALEIDYPRSLFFYAWAFSLLLVTLGREVHRALKNGLRRRGIARDNLLIVGTGQTARDIAERIRATPELGYHIVGFASDKIKPKGEVMNIPVLGLYTELSAIIDAYNIVQVIIALPDAHRNEIVDLVTLCQRGRVDIKVYPDIYAHMARDMSVDDLGGVPLLTVRDISLRGWKLSLKRGMDLTVSLLGLIFLSPFILLIAWLIRLESRGSPFYAQLRMGLDGSPFLVIKFRSMRQDAEVDGPGWTVQNDPRITRVGRLLRKTEIDELPQLINVLLGQMSLVGPRPERPVYVQEFRAKIPRYMERHREKAGMTGWAQVNGLRGDTSIEDRTEYDLWYVENWSLWLDIKIIVRTLWMIFARKNEKAY